MESIGPGQGELVGQVVRQARVIRAALARDLLRPVSRRPFADEDAANADVDGVGLLDAEDDQDNDDVPNIYALTISSSAARR